MIIFSLLVLIPFAGITETMMPAYADTQIIVNQTTPCFLNYTASFHMLENCNAKDDWLKFALLPFEWVTGGYFSLIVASVLVLITYLKYHKAIYPVMIGIIFIPTAFYLYPQTWIIASILFVVATVGIMLFKAMYINTKEY